MGCVRYIVPFPICIAFFAVSSLCRGGAHAEQAPGFAVFLVASALGVFCAHGVEANVSAGGGFFDWDDVPDLVRSDVGGDEVDLVSRILTRRLATAGASGGDAVSLAVGGKGRFDLDAQQATVGFDYEVVGFAVSVGLAYGESKAGRFDYEY